MASRFSLWNLFSRKPKDRDNTSRFKSQSHDSSVALNENNDFADHRKSVLEQKCRGIIELSLSSFGSRVDERNILWPTRASTNSPRSFVSSQLKQKERNEFGLPATVLFLKPGIVSEKPSSIRTAVDHWQNSEKSPEDESTLISGHSRVDSKHSDLLDAESARKLCWNSPEQPEETERLDYGEDVAAQNIEDFNDLKLDFSSPQFGYLETLYLRNKRSVDPSGRDDVSNTRRNSAWGHLVEPSHDAASDLTGTCRDRHTSISPSLSSQNTSFRPSLFRFPIPPTAPKYESDADSSPASAVPRWQEPWRRSPSKALSIDETRGAAIPFSAAVPDGTTLNEDVCKDGYQTSRLLAEPYASTLIVPPTPRLSPVTDLSVATPLREPKLERSCPSKSKRGFRYSAALLLFPPPSSSRKIRRHKLEMATPSKTTPEAENDDTRNVIVEGAPKLPSLEGIVDLTNSTETTVHSSQLPAVTHEYVTPTVHHITEEKITREIHHHDIFHRIQPVIDVEILPTKNFVHDKDGSLKEVPASELPGRQDNWHIATGPAPLSSHQHTSSDLKVASSAATETVYPLEPSENKPIQTSHRIIQSSDGVERTETAWRHPSELWPTSHDDDHSSSSAEANNYSYSPRKTSENLQSRETSYAYGGRWSSFKEKNLMSVPRSSVTTPDRIKAVMEKGENFYKKMKTRLSSDEDKSYENETEDVERKMESLSVKE